MYLSDGIVITTIVVHTMIYPDIVLNNEAKISKLFTTAIDNHFFIFYSFPFTFQGVDSSIYSIPHKPFFHE